MRLQSNHVTQAAASAPKNTRKELLVPHQLLAPACPARARSQEGQSRGAMARSPLRAFLQDHPSRLILFPWICCPLQDCSLSFCKGHPADSRVMLQLFSAISQVAPTAPHRFWSISVLRLQVLFLQAAQVTSTVRKSFSRFNWLWKSQILQQFAFQGLRRNSEGGEEDKLDLKLAPVHFPATGQGCIGLGAKPMVVPMWGQAR